MYMYVRITVQLSPESATLLQSAESRLQTHLKLHTCTLYGTVRRSGIDTNSRELSAVLLFSSAECDSTVENVSESASCHDVERDNHTCAACLQY